MSDTPYLCRISEHHGPDACDVQHVGAPNTAPVSDAGVVAAHAQEPTHCGNAMVDAGSEPGCGLGAGAGRERTPAADSQAVVNSVQQFESQGWVEGRRWEQEGMHAAFAQAVGLATQVGAGGDPAKSTTASAPIMALADPRTAAPSPAPPVAAWVEARAPPTSPASDHVQIKRHTKG